MVQVADSIVCNDLFLKVKTKIFVKYFTDFGKAFKYLEKKIQVINLFKIESSYKNIESNNLTDTR